MGDYFYKLLGAFAAAWVLCGAAPSFAQTARDDAAIFSFALENDLFSDSDRHYTNGIRLSYLSPRKDNWEPLRRAVSVLPFIQPDSDVRFDYGVGQNMYTPRDIDRVPADPTDRPYAGWLYGSVGLVVERDDMLDQFQISLGVVGPASLAKEAQKFFHNETNSQAPHGWQEQLDNEVTVQTFYRRSWRAFESGELLGFSFDVTPHVGGALGNVHIYGDGGLTVRFGFELPNDYGPPRVDPALAGSGYFKPQASFGWYLFAGADGRLVARNMFLDGNTFEDGPSVNRRSLVGDFQMGAAVIIGGARVAYTHVFRSREFETQEQPDSYGAVSLSFRF